MRLLPKSLTMQLVLLLLVALVIIQGASFIILYDERHFTAREVGRQHVLYRTASAVRLLNEAPQSMHNTIVKSLNTPRLRIDIENNPSIDSTPSDRRSRRLSRILKSALGQQALNIHLKVVRNSKPLLPRDNESPYAHRWRDRSPDARHNRHFRDNVVRRHLLGLGISVQLHSGQWLNVTTLVPTLPPAFGTYSLLTLVLSAVILTLIVVLMIRRVTKPMRQLADAAELLGRGEEIGLLPEKGPEDIRHTTRAFNTMQERLKRFVQGRTQMLAAISHDLRTPITSLRLRTEMVKDPTTREKIIASLDEMQSIIEATLEFSSRDAAQEETRTVNLTALGESVCHDLNDIGLECHFLESEEFHYRCRAGSLKRALGNLVENAAHYGNKAEVSLKKENGELIFTIEDQGPGIPDDELERVFDPFVRLEGSRSRETGGIGLGLAIARTIVRAHGGDIIIRNRVQGGLHAEIRLPILKLDA